MLVRKAPLESGRETEIDMIEREMEGGVLVIQVPGIHEHYAERSLGGLIAIEEDIEVHQMTIEPEPPVAPRAAGRRKRGPSRGG